MIIKVPFDSDIAMVNVNFHESHGNVVTYNGKCFSRQEY